MKQRTEREMEIISAELKLIGTDYTKLAETLGVSRTLVWMSVKGQRNSDKALKIRNYVEKLVANKGGPPTVVKRKLKTKN